VSLFVLLISTYKFKNILNLFYLILKKLELNQMENLDGGRRFWGWSRDEDITYGNCGPDGLQYGSSAYYVLGFVVDTKAVTRVC
jgi:hypothetical protein